MRLQRFKALLLFVIVPILQLGCSSRVSSTHSSIVAPTGTLDQASLYVPPPPPTPHNTLTSATFQSGPFLFDFRLYQDPGFGPDAAMAWQYSDIPGMGHYVSWVYHSPERNDITEAWGICPDVSPRTGIGDIRDGWTEMEDGGFLLPKGSQPGDQIKFVYEIITSEGTYGGVIRFTLAQGAQGFEPIGITITSLKQAVLPC